MIIVADDSLRRHLATALTAHMRELHRGGIVAPVHLRELVAELARSGLERTTIDDEDQAPEDQAMVLTLDYRTAGTALGVSDRSIRRLVAAGKLDAVEVAGCKRIRIADLREYVDGLAPITSQGDS